MRCAICDLNVTSGKGTQAAGMLIHKCCKHLAFTIECANCEHGVRKTHGKYYHKNPGKIINQKCTCGCNEPERKRFV